jgi:hypothetical protein
VGTWFVRIYELRVFESCVIEPGADEFGGVANFARVGRVRADAGDAEEAEEIVHFPYNGIFKSTRPIERDAS